MMKQGTLHDYVKRCFVSFSDQNDFIIAERPYSYEEIRAMANDIASTIVDVSREIFIGVYANRSAAACSAVFAVILAGKAYMPVNPFFPAERVAYMMRQSECRTIVLSSESLDLFRRTAPLLEPTTVIFLQSECNLSDEFPQHCFVPVANVGMEVHAVAVRPESPAYLMFTSGSTGKPKGVIVTQGNVLSYLMHTLSCYDFGRDDRFSQAFDLTFDLSAHDLFVSLGAGASLHMIPGQQFMEIADCIRERKLTVCFSVPSVIMFLSRMRILKKGAFPSLRYSLFCGEALPANSAQEWADAAPNSVVENLYGPTEATIAISRFPIPSPMPAFPNGIVPIGQVFEGHGKKIVNQEMGEVELGDTGELCVSGSQITVGYINNELETEKRFVRFPGSESIWYRTGDLVRDTADGMLFLGRVDEQVQIKGYRVELQEIDGVLRDACGHDMAVAVAASFLGMGGYDNVCGVVLLTENHRTAEEIIDFCRSRLPAYMVPSRIEFIPEIPLNSNGKINRKEISQWISPTIS